MRLKKITIGNPLANFGLMDELEEYDLARTDEELAFFFHKMLDMADHRPLLRAFIHAMISYSTQQSTNIEILLNHEV